MSMADSGHASAGIANNSLITVQHGKKLAELDELFSMDLDSLLDQRPDIRYIFVSFPFFATGSARWHTNSGELRRGGYDEQALAVDGRSLVGG